MPQRHAPGRLSPKHGQNEALDRNRARPTPPHTCWVGLAPGQTRVTAFGFSLPLQHAGLRGEAARLLSVLCPHGRWRSAFLSLTKQQHSVEWGSQPAGQLARAA